MTTFRVFDTEGVGLNHKTERLWNMSWTDDGEDIKFTTGYDQMREWLAEPDIIWVAHNAIDHDMEAFRVVLGVDLSYKWFWDSLAVSWALFPHRPKHGLEYLGKEHGILKVDVKEHQWAEGDPDLMKDRVITDVKINWKEFLKQKKRLEELYGTT